MRDSELILSVLLYRAVVLLIIRTSYVPDEYFQYQEPAFKAAFPEVATELTWEWREDFRIRSYLPLVPLILAYRLSSILLGPKWQSLVMTILPRLLQMLLTAFADFYFYKLARWCFNSRYATTSLMIHLFSWFGTYCLCRPLSNSMEHGLLIIVSNFSIAIWLATLSVFVRPTIAVLWAPMFLYISKNEWNVWVGKCFHIISQIGFVIQVGVLIDSAFYGTFTFTPWNFYITNVVEKRAESFGVNSWHFYLSNGVPTVLGLYFPYYVYGLTLERVPRPIRALANLSFWNVIVLAIFTRHSEHRFLLPLLPFFHLLIGWVVYKHFNNQSIFSDSKKVSAKKSSWLFGGSWLMIIFSLHTLFAGYLLHFHQAGPEQAYRYLRQLHVEQLEEGHPKSVPPMVLVASTCFSFLGYSSLNIGDNYFKIVSLPCVPPWEGQDIFSIDPNEGFNQLFSMYDQVCSTCPTYILTYDSYISQLESRRFHKNITFVVDFEHAAVQYDFDDPFPKYKALLFIMNVENHEGESL